MSENRFASTAMPGYETRIDATSGKDNTARHRGAMAAHSWRPSSLRIIGSAPRDQWPKAFPALPRACATEFSRGRRIGGAAGYFRRALSRASPHASPTPGAPALTLASRQ